MKKLLQIILIVSIIFIITGFSMAENPDGVLKAILIIEDQYKDPKLNNIADSTNMDCGLVTKFLDTLDQQKVIKVEKTLLRGSTGTRQNIITLLKNIRLDSGSVLFVYFSGHGGMEKKNTFLLTAEGDFLYRTELESLVKAKSARLSLVFTDACSSSIDSIGGRGSFLPNSKERESAYIEIYKNLLYNYQGLMYVTSATEGEYAWGGREGGSFTKSLFYEVLLQDPKLSWEENFNEAKSRTQEKFTYMANMGFLRPEDLRDMEKKGIKGQTPKAYSLPTLNNQVAINNQTIENQQKVETVATQNVQAVIRNLTKSTISFYIDNNTTYDKNWSWDNCKEQTIRPNASITLADNKPVVVFFDNRNKKTLCYELKEGSYVFEDEKGGTINLFTETSYEPTTEQAAENKKIQHKTGVGSILCQ